MPTTAQSATFAAIATAVRDQLVAATDLDDSRVFVTADDGWQLALAERCLYLRVYGIQPDTDAGAGRRARPAKRRLRVYVYTRNSLDVYGDNITAIFGDGEHDSLTHAVLDGLDEFVPVDGDGDALVLEPLHPIDSDSGPPARAEPDVGMVRSHLDFEVRYLLPNTTPAPGA